MERRDRQVVVYFVVALAASLGLGLAIAYLEVRRSQEIVTIEMRFFQELERMQKEINSLREDLENKTSRLQEKINTTVQQTYSGGPRGAEEDYYYDDEYEYEDGDEDERGGGKEDRGGKEGGKEGGGKRNKREIRVNPILAPYNLILRQGYKSHPNRTGPPEVKAHIIVNSDSQQGYGHEPESFEPPQKSYSLGNNVAVHFKGDTSRIRHQGRHSDSRCKYDVNHRMCHVSGMFRDWSMDNWNEMSDNTFSMREGHLTINRNPGIYYLYAQIFYADNHDINGYRIYVNGSPTFQCTVTNLHDDRWIPHRVPYKKNSCFTGGLVELKEGDHITIREIDNVERYSVFEPYKSYFGLFRVVPLPSSKSKR